MRPRHVVLLTFSSDGHCPLWSYPYIGTFPRLISFVCHSYENCRVCTQNSQSGNLCCAFANLISSSSSRKSFRCNTYKNTGTGAPPFDVPTPIPAHAQAIPNPLPRIPLPTDHGLLITDHVATSGSLPTFQPANEWSIASLLHCFPHGTPTPRPTLPRRSPLARRDCSRHSRFAAFHRAASAGRSTLLDRNWFWTR